MTTFVEIFGGIERLEDILQRFMASEDDHVLDWPEYADVFIAENDAPMISRIFEDVDSSGIFEAVDFELDPDEEPLAGIFTSSDEDSLVYPAPIFIERDGDDGFKQIRNLIIL